MVEMVIAGWMRVSRRLGTRALERRHRCRLSEEKVRVPRCQLSLQNMDLKKILHVEGSELRIQISI